MAGVTIEYSIENEIVPFKLVKYQDGEEPQIAEAATATLQIGDKIGNIMLVQDQSGDGKMILHQSWDES